MHAAEEELVRFGGDPEFAGGEDPGLNHLDDLVNEQRPGAESGDGNQYVEAEGPEGEAADPHRPSAFDRRGEVEPGPDGSGPDLPREDADDDAGPEGYAQAGEQVGRDDAEPRRRVASGNPVGQGEEAENQEECRHQGGKRPVEPAAGQRFLRGGMRLNRRMCQSAAIPSRHPIFFPSS